MKRTFSGFFNIKRTADRASVIRDSTYKRPMHLPEERRIADGGLQRVNRDLGRKVRRTRNGFFPAVKEGLRDHIFLDRSTIHWETLLLSFDFRVVSGLKPVTSRRFLLDFGIALPPIMSKPTSIFDHCISRSVSGSLEAVHWSVAPVVGKPAVLRPLLQQPLQSFPGRFFAHTAFLASRRCG